jgi:hypothetical protein
LIEKFLNISNEAPTKVIPEVKKLGDSGYITREVWYDDICTDIFQHNVVEAKVNIKKDKKDSTKSLANFISSY